MSPSLVVSHSFSLFSFLFFFVVEAADLCNIKMRKKVSLLVHAMLQMSF